MLEYGDVPHLFFGVIADFLAPSIVCMPPSFDDFENRRVD
jgi:hypothetical protein